jgi:DNA replication protein DnaC
MELGQGLNHCGAMGYVSGKTRNLSNQYTCVSISVVALSYERQSIIMTTNLEFSKWPQVFHSEQLTGTLLDRLTHHAHILTMNGESYRFKQSMSKKKRQ